MKVSKSSVQQALFPKEIDSLTSVAFPFVCNKSNPSALAMMDCTRLWLPAQLCNSSVKEESSLALVGWVNVGQKSLDLVVAAACPVPQFSNPIIRQLQEVLDAAETKLPLALRMERKLCVMGQYFACPDGHSDIRNDNEGNEDAPRARDGQCNRREDDGDNLAPSERGILKSSGVGSCRSGQKEENYQKFDSKTRLQDVTNVWAVVSACKSSGKRNGLEWIPYMRSLSLGGYPSSVKDHIVIYQQPVFGSHHFSCSPWTPCYEVSSKKSFGQKSETSMKRPQWLTAMEQQEGADMPFCLSVEASSYATSLCELGSKVVTCSQDMAMVELNCATYVDGILKDTWPPAGFIEEYSTLSICCDYVWSPIAVVMAIWAAILYALAQGLVVVLAVWLPAVPYLGSLLQGSMTWQAVHIRCQQLMAWPFILLWGGLGPGQPNVAIAHQIATARYSTWSVLLIDKIAGAMTGYFLLKHSDSIIKLVVQTGQMLTNDVLRTGCIWLMGVPAGFKLNNELAAAIGTMSLHVIQSWSTLLYSLIPAIKILLNVLGISSLLLGFTIPAAMISDMIFLSTFHISCLHHAVAFLHTNQLRALASLWRLFRGRKRNPLRRRLDTFECSVEQLVVGSLMFTPLLLLLPTTSVYYTFFSMIFLTQSSVQVMLHYIVATFHCFPLSLVAIWMIRPEQFPSGVCFLFLEPTYRGNKHQGALLSTLGIRTASFAELLKPFLKSLWVVPAWSSAASFVYKVVSGERYHLKLQLGHMAALPHSPLSLMGFARLSYIALVKASPRLLGK